MRTPSSSKNRRRLGSKDGVRPQQSSAVGQNGTSFVSRTIPSCAGSSIWVSPVPSVMSRTMALAVCLVSPSPGFVIAFCSSPKAKCAFVPASRVERSIFGTGGDGARGARQRHVANEEWIGSSALTPLSRPPQRRSAGAVNPRDNGEHRGRKLPLRRRPRWSFGAPWGACHGAADYTARPAPPSSGRRARLGAPVSVSVRPAGREAAPGCAPRSPRRRPSRGGAGAAGRRVRRA